MLPVFAVVPKLVACRRPRYPENRSPLVKALRLLGRLLPGDQLKAGGPRGPQVFRR